MRRATEHPVFVALEPLLLAVGGHVVESANLEAGDVPVRWENEVIGGVRIGSLSHALDRMASRIEAEMGGPLASLSRVEKQQAVRLLDEQGAFLLRKSIDDIAERMGVSRITIYNYLAAIRDD